MNPKLKQLHPYPFEKLKQLKHGIVPPAEKSAIALSIGEPKHPTPDFIQHALQQHLPALVNYPTTRGTDELRQTIAHWICRRFSIEHPFMTANDHVLPVNGTREALFAFAQTIIDPSKQPIVIMPNPFYQIYEGAALLAGAEPYYLNTTADNHYRPDFDSIPVDILERCQLFFICSPANPSGSVLDQSDHEKLIALAQHYNFVIASDECYSEIYADENHPPQGLLQTAFSAGYKAFERCVIFHSLSKRSNAPGLRSGFVAGDASLIKQFLHYRTYHGCAMSLPVQQASIVAWEDETHVLENRNYYREKYNAVISILSDVCIISQPPGSFYIWLKTTIADTEFAQGLFALENVTVLPGSFLSREANGINPGQNHVRMALVAPLDDCIDAAYRIKQFIKTL
ncbi:MAG: succinyldiaminopimelate transaminase [Methylococcales bacterium]|nr:succinyldiaminopimelate transaminase [Methylococcales bacterium]